MSVCLHVSISRGWGEGFIPTAGAVLCSPPKCYIYIAGSRWHILLPDAGWLIVDRNYSRVHPEKKNCKKKKNPLKIKKSRMKSTESGWSEHFSSLSTLSFSSLYVITSLFSMAGWHGEECFWLTEPKQQSKNDPQTGCAFPLPPFDNRDHCRHTGYPWTGANSEHTSYPEQ